jgi:hypothetical protein
MVSEAKRSTFQLQLVNPAPVSLYLSSLFIKWNQIGPYLTFLPHSFFPFWMVPGLNSRLARKVLYSLSHTSSLFSSAYFRDRVLRFAQDSCHCWNDRCMLPHPAFFHWDGLSKAFMSQLAWSSNLPDLSLPCSLGWQAGATVTSYWLRWDGVFSWAGLKLWYSWFQPPNLSGL